MATRYGDCVGFFWQAVGARSAICDSRTQNERNGLSVEVPCKKRESQIASLAPKLHGSDAGRAADRRSGSASGDRGDPRVAAARCPCVAGGRHGGAAIGVNGRSSLIELNGVSASGLHNPLRCCRLADLRGSIDEQRLALDEIQYHTRLTVDPPLFVVQSDSWCRA